MKRKTYFVRIDYGNGIYEIKEVAKATWKMVDQSKDLKKPLTRKKGGAPLPSDYVQCNRPMNDAEYANTVFQTPKSRQFYLGLIRNPPALEAEKPNKSKDEIRMPPGMKARMEASKDGSEAANIEPGNEAKPISLEDSTDDELRAVCKALKIPKTKWNRAKRPRLLELIANILT